MHVTKSLTAYEDVLREELGAEIVEQGLQKKRKDMRASAFAFLRASFWRWAETVQTIVPELMTAPAVLAVGDIHLENFGTWRDADGRLVWGVNDFDEAAAMPYPLDLLRLATSALLAAGVRHAPAEIAEHLLGGYRAGLRAPRPFVLDRDHGWLREAVIVPEDERARFWDKLAEKRAGFEAKSATKRPALPPRYREALLTALPPEAEAPVVWYRSAGLGSLGRPRWVAEAQWRGEVVMREAKGIVPSAWMRTPGRGGRAIRCMEIATGRFRAPDPHYRVADGIAVRRLSPNSRKINAEGDRENGIGLDLLLSGRMLAAMGADLAVIHVGTGHFGMGDAATAIIADLDEREDAWLAPAAIAMASAVEKDFRALG